MTKRVELRAERMLWRACALVTPVRATIRFGARPRSSVVVAVVLAYALIAVAAGFGLAAIGTLVGGSGVLTFVVGFWLGPLAVLLGFIAGGLWSGTGAGRPVLVLDGDEVRGRLRPTQPGEAKSVAPSDPSWWDLRLPAEDLEGVRLARTDRRAYAQLLVLDLPADLQEELARRPELQKRITWSRRVAGSPAAWNAGAMLPWWRRKRGLGELVTSFEEARTARESRHKP